MGDAERNPSAPVEASHAALVPSNDDRLVALARQKPALETFLSAFHNEFGNQVAPTIGLVPEDALKSVLTVTAFGGFRDAVCMSAVIASQTRTTTLTFRWRTAEDHERDAEAAEAERLLDEGKTIECERAEASGCAMRGSRWSALDGATTSGPSNTRPAKRLLTRTKNLGDGSIKPAAPRIAAVDNGLARLIGWLVFQGVEALSREAPE